MRRQTATAGFALLWLTAACHAQGKAIDPARSSITIHVGKAGLLSAAGHEHWVSAPLASGSLDDSASPSVRFTVDTRRMLVKPDEKLNAKDQAEVQETMQRKVLESEKFPEIKFQSTAVRRTGPGAWQVTGTLSLHGVEQPVTAAVKLAGDAYAGAARIRQTDFGITPVNVGGVIKVKNELEIRFEIRMAGGLSPGLGNASTGLGNASK